MMIRRPACNALMWRGGKFVRRALIPQPCGGRLTHEVAQERPRAVQPRLDRAEGQALTVRERLVAAALDVERDQRARLGIELREREIEGVENLAGAIRGTRIRNLEQLIVGRDGERPAALAAQE